MIYVRRDRGAQYVHRSKASAEPGTPNPINIHQSAINKESTIQDREINNPVHRFTPCVEVGQGESLPCWEGSATDARSDRR
jgi:hypothetical protein